MRIHFRRVILWVVAILSLVFLIAISLLVSDGLHDKIAKADVALVLGNKVEVTGEPSARLKARLDRAIELFRDGTVEYIIASGAKGKEGFDEATVMSAYLNRRGVPIEKIIVDSNGVTTQASAVNAARIMRDKDFKKILVVSQYFHISRTKLALRKMGVESSYSAHAHFFEFRDLYSIPREVAGYASYYFRKFE